MTRWLVLRVVRRTTVRLTGVIPPVLMTVPGAGALVIAKLVSLYLGTIIFNFKLATRPGRLLKLSCAIENLNMKGLYQATAMVIDFRLILTESKYFIDGHGHSCDD